MEKSLKYLLLIGIIAFSLVPSYVLSFDNLSSLQQPTGFREVYWGSSKYNHPYLFSVSDNVDGAETFSKECEKFTLGSAEVHEITYHFYHDKFYQVSLMLDSGSDHQPLLNELIEAYGTPEKESGMYLWDNDIISIRLSPSGAALSYLPILNEISQNTARFNKLRY